MATTTQRPDHAPAPATGGRERRITEFRPEDAAAVAEMFMASQEGWPGGFWGGLHVGPEQVLELQRGCAPLATFRAWYGDACAGYCSFYDYPDEPGLAGYVGLLNAATAFHGRGHGRDLLRAALQRGMELGYRRIDLHTWQGNMRAVPLYKKSGYYWVPDSSVHMENYLPLLLHQPLLADFWAEADWYRAMLRDLSVREDLYLDGKMRVYPYEFRHGDRYVKALIDATARGLTALETERWKLRCRVDDRTLIIGRPRTVRWEVENRTGRPLALTLLASAGDGLHLAKEVTVSVRDRYTAEAELTADPDYAPPEPGRPAPMIESLLLVDGVPLHLETGVRVTPPVLVRLSPGRVGLLPGRRKELAVQVVNRLEEPATATLVIAPSPGLTLTPTERRQQPGEALEVPVELEAEGYGGSLLGATAQRSGLPALEVRGSVQAGGDTIPLQPLRLPLAAVQPGEVAAYEADTLPALHAERDTRGREVIVESSALRLVAGTRSGRFHLEDAETGRWLAGGEVQAGPPFSWSAQAHVRHQVAVERQDGAVTLLLRGPAPHLPAAIAEHRLRLSADGLLAITTTLTNSGAAPLEAQAGLDIWAGDLKTRVLPTMQGVVRTGLPEFPDWNEPALLRPGQFREGWLAGEGEGTVVGLLWSELARLEPRDWGLAELRQGEGTLAPGERRTLPPVYLYAGPGDWTTVRSRWRSLVAPNAPRQDPPTREAVELVGAAGAALLLAGQANRLTLSSLTERLVEGELRFMPPDGWLVEPAQQAVGGLRLGRDQALECRAEHAAARPAAAALRAVLRSERREERVFDGALLDLGGHPGGVRLGEGSRDGRRLLTVDNGHLRLSLAPDFLGSVVALETVADGVYHLHSAFPEPREFGWMRPWYGGLYAAVYSPGIGEFPDAGRLDEETFQVEPAEEPGQDGRTWTGLAVSTALHGRGLAGLALRAVYLTLPGSNLLALRLTLRNATSATLGVEAALVAYLQPGGAVEDAELLLDPAGRRRLRRAQRTIDVAADRWIAARNPASGTTIALVPTRGPDARVVGVDWGGLGVHLGLRFQPRLEPHGEQSALAYLALARDEAEAAAYRPLEGAEGLL